MSAPCQRLYLVLETRAAGDALPLIFATLMLNSFAAGRPEALLSGSNLKSTLRAPSCLRRLAHGCKWWRMGRSDAPRDWT